MHMKKMIQDLGLHQCTASTISKKVAVEEVSGRYYWVHKCKKLAPCLAQLLVA